VIFSPSLKVSPGLRTIVYWLASSLGVIDLASTRVIPPLASKVTNPSKSWVTTFQPAVSLVLEGISGAVGSALLTLMAA